MADATTSTNVPEAHVAATDCVQTPLDHTDAPAEPDSTCTADTGDVMTSTNVPPDPTFAPDKECFASTPPDLTDVPADPDTNSPEADVSTSTNVPETHAGNPANTVTTLSAPTTVDADLDTLLCQSLEHVSTSTSV